MAAVSIGVGELAAKRHNVGSGQRTCEIKERRQEIPSKETTVSGDTSKGMAFERRKKMNGEARKREEQRKKCQSMKPLGMRVLINSQRVWINLV